MLTPALMAAVAFVLTVPWGGLAIAQLAKHGLCKRIRPDGPSSHQTKAGTPTMGGLYMLAGMIVLSIVLAIAGHLHVLVPLGVMLAFGLLGAFDDMRGLRDALGVGWLARSKFPWQWAVALLCGVGIYAFTGARTVIVPISGREIPIGLGIIPIATVLIVFGANAVNLTDGLDGLAGGTCALAFGAYGILSAMLADRGLALFCFAACGVVGAFLWYNVHPARVFMGDVGSEALGAGLAAVALLSRQWILLPVVGVVFFVVVLSVVLQVSYFKYTRRRYGEGRRIFRMAPLQHHLELLGWSEEQVTARLWLVAAVAAAAGVALGAT